jgi:heme/copper-type cytochrome/quinol oxidase subunit 3
VSEAAGVAPAIDVSALPSCVFGRRSALFWGVLLLIFIEGTMLGIVFCSYIYVQGNYLTWPPAARMPLAPGLLTLIALVVSCAPMELARRAAKRMDLVKTRRWLVVGTLIGVAAGVFRAWTFGTIPFTWRQDSYTSIVWLALGTHATELAASVLESVTIIALLFIGPVEKKHFEDAAVGVVFWLFAALVWVPFGILFLADGAHP